MVRESERKEEVGRRERIDGVGDHPCESIKIGWFGAVALLEFITPEWIRSEFGQGLRILYPPNRHHIHAGAKSTLKIPFENRCSERCVAPEDCQHVNVSREFQ